MSKHKYINRIMLACAFLLGGWGCQKVQTGYLSSDLYYLQNPLTAPQGSITVSSVLQVNGSTAPMNVLLTKVLDSSGNSVDSMMAKKDSFPGFADAVSYVDSTLDLLNKKIVYTTAAPLSVNPIGGRIQLTPATKYIPQGTYTIDIKASNVRGSVSIPNACKIIITSAGSPDTVFAGAYAGTLDKTTGAYLAALANPSVNVQFYPSAVNKIVFKWVDMNGKVYDAKTGGVGVRSGRWNFRNFDPYYPQVLTDTSVEYQYPTVPNEFPVYPNTGADGTIPRGNFGCFFKLPGANSTGGPIFTFTDIAFFTQGLYVVTITQPDVSWN
ncbi:MAG TPA: hypothetical protein VL832_04135 [Puia sp.]|nr:hypothetical protein [Puia sp.]